MAEKLSPISSASSAKLQRDLIKVALQELNVIIQHPDELADWYTIQPMSVQNITFTRILNALANASDTAGMRQVLSASQVDIYNTVNLELGILLIRFHLMNSDYAPAEHIYGSLVSRGTEYHRKKHLELLVQYLAEQLLWVQASELYLKYYMNYLISGKDLEVFMPAPHEVRMKILQLAVKQPLYLTSHEPYPGVQYALPGTDGLIQDYKLQKFTFTEEEQLKLLDMLKAIFNRPECVKQFQSILGDKSRYDYIIDGANVLHFVDREILPHSYKRLDQVICKLLDEHRDARVLLVLHERHFRVSQYRWKRYQQQDVEDIIHGWSHCSQIVVCKTPYKFNDDYYSIAYAVSHPEALLVTNDKFRDHIFKLSAKSHNLDLLAQWRQESVIEYQEKRNVQRGRTVHDIQFIMPTTWSQRVQCSDSTYYVPVKSQTQLDEWAIVRAGAL